MISYRKLRILVKEDRKLILSHVCKEAGVSTNLVTKINNDQSIELKSLEKICLYLGIEIEDAVEFIDEDKEDNNTIKKSQI